MNTALHLCTPAEAPQLLGLMARFSEEVGFDQPAEAREKAVLPLLEGHPYGMAYLLGPARAPVGYVIVTLGWSIELGGLEAWIDEIFVRPAIRGRGIATEVLHALSRSLRDADVRVIHLEVDRDAPATQRIYQKAGFEMRDRFSLMTRTL